MSNLFFFLGIGHRDASNGIFIARNVLIFGKAKGYLLTLVFFSLRQKTALHMSNVLNAVVLKLFSTIK